MAFMNTPLPKFTILPFIFLIINSLGAQETCSHHDHSEHISPGDRIGFVENKGQWEEDFSFKANIGGLNTLFLENNAFTYLFHDENQMQGLHDAYYQTDFKSYLVDAHSYKVHFLGANDPVLRGQEKRQTHLNFFHGNDQSKWISNASVFDKIRYENLYDNIHLETYSKGADFKYDFIVQPNGKVSEIRLHYQGAESLELKDGNLIVTTSVNVIQELAPYAWQLIDGKETQVPCQYVLKNNTITFHFPEGYDNTLPLVIDPVVLAATLSHRYF